MLPPTVYSSIVEEFLYSDVFLPLTTFLYGTEEGIGGEIHCLLKLIRETHFRHNVECHDWLEKYNKMEFFQLFRMKTSTFQCLLKLIMEQDKDCLIRKKYRGGNYPVAPEKSLLVFLWVLARQDNLHSIGDRFKIVPSTVMKIVNIMLYIIVGMKKNLIQWPHTQEDFEYIKNGFTNYPGTIGAVDGCHVNIKVPVNQQDSYTDRFHQHSINLMAICTKENILTYVFVGYPGSAHDSRVFSNSSLVKNVERQGTTKYFPDESYHIIGDSAFPLRSWLLTPFPRRANMTRIQKYHNYKLSADRVCSENTFALIKLRWARLFFINTYCISKAIEITTAACVLHNFCYLNKDFWTVTIPEAHIDENENPRVIGDDQVLGIQKRNYISEQIWIDR